MNPIFPSILSTDFFNLAGKLDQMVSSGIEFIHLDIMDGHFVDNISFGPSLCSSLKAKYPFRIDSHLMVSNPDKIVPYFIAAGSDWISFHLEAASDPEKLISLIRGANRKAGLVLNPETVAERILPYFPLLDFILVMSVRPGFGGQKFMPESIARLELLARHKKSTGSGLLLQIDGGLNSETLGDAARAGGEIFVIGSALYTSSDIAKKINEYENILQGAIDEA